MITGIVVMKACDSLFIEFSRKYVHGYIRLAVLPRLDRYSINFFDRIIADWHTADRNAVPVNKDIASQMTAASENLVRSIRIIDSERQVIIAERIEALNFVKAFGHLSITLGSFWTERA